MNDSATSTTTLATTTLSSSLSTTTFRSTTTSSEPSATTLATTLDTTSGTTIEVVSESIATSSSTELSIEDSSETGSRFPYAIVLLAALWLALVLVYLISRWRQRSRATYMIPRVFVLCSPRTVQFNYELILRVGLPSYDFNPEKHDIDLSILGQQKNEVLPVTRLNTRTLLDEPLMTNLSLVVYRLVEMPPLGALVLHHSGPFRAWVYAYDLTVIDANTFKEHYYPLNHYIGSMAREIPLTSGSQASNSVNYPIDDVPLPEWSSEDVFLVPFTAANFALLAASSMPTNCGLLDDMVSVLAIALAGASALLFLLWLLYYHSRWSQDRKEYFNQPMGCWLLTGSTWIRLSVLAAGTIFGLVALYQTLAMTRWREALVWTLAASNGLILVLVIWNLARLLELGEWLVLMGLRMRGIKTQSVGIQHSEIVSRHNSSLVSDDDLPAAQVASKVGGHQSSTLKSGVRGSGPSLMIGPRSSVKSFGFGPALKAINSDSPVASPRSHMSNQFSQTSQQHQSVILASKRPSAKGPGHKVVGQSNNQRRALHPSSQAQHQSHANQMVAQDKSSSSKSLRAASDPAHGTGQAAESQRSANQSSSQSTAKRDQTARAK